MNFKFPLLFFFLLLFTFSVKSQNGVNIPGFSGVDSVINKFLDTWELNGGSAAITKNGKLIYNKGFGFSDHNNSVPVQPYHKFRIASLSKPVTAIAIMKLVEQGRLKITDTVFGNNKILNQKYYLGVISDPAIYSITIQNLLEHTAGWDRDMPCDGFSHSDPILFPLHVSAVLREPNPVGDSTLIKFSLMKGLNHAPGTSFAYSNVGYLVLGKVIEKISGMKYEQFVKQTIFEPLGITDIEPGKNLMKNKLERESDYNSAYFDLSCYGDGKLVQTQYGGLNLEAMGAHGGWVATSSDLSKLILAVDGFTTVPDILKKETIELMTTGGAANRNYAKGWFVNKKNNWWHSGSLPGSASFMCRLNNGYTFVFLFNNRSNNGNEFWNALDHLWKDCIKNMREMPETDLFSPSRNISSLEAKTGTTNATLKWNSGNGDGRIIIASEEPVTYFPKDGEEYSASAVFGKGSRLGNGMFVVYNGSDNKVVLSNLKPGKTYYINGFEYKKNTGTTQLVYKVGGRAKAIVTSNPVSTKTVTSTVVLQ